MNNFHLNLVRNLQWLKKFGSLALIFQVQSIWSTNYAAWNFNRPRANRNILGARLWGAPLMHNESLGQLTRRSIVPFFLSSTAISLSQRAIVSTRSWLPQTLVPSRDWIGYCCVQFWWCFIRWRIRWRSWIPVFILLLARKNLRMKARCNELGLMSCENMN